MGTASAKTLSAALVNAKSVGMVEEKFQLGDCEVVLRNLRPDEYESVIEETKELEDMAYLNGWQRGHVCRSIVEINGVDLRDIDLVEVEEQDPKDKTKTKMLKRELHDWVRRYVLASWSKEALYTAYRKFSDVLYLAEKKAKEGVTFVVAEETGEDKYRRLLGELKEMEGEVPTQLIPLILEEYGYTHYTRPADAKALEDFAETMAEEAPAPEAAPATPPPAPAPPAESGTDAALKAAQIMRQRVPLNQRASEVPDVPQPMAAVPPTPAARPVQTPVITPAPAVVMSRRSQEIADALASEPGAVSEEELQALRAPVPQAVIPPGMPGYVPPTAPRVVLEKQGRHTDPQGLGSILNQPPSGVMNPKFRPPPTR